ncbi:MAG: hypothetical protein ACODAB_00610 [Gemmatimonadota bacterium]
MRKFAALFLALAFLGLDAGLATAQDAEAAHPTVTLTGCLDQDDDDGEFELEGIESEAIDGDEVALSVGEGVNLAPHVGHTVEATGMLIEEGMADDVEDADDGYPDVDDADDAGYVYVTNLSHISASCESS